MAIFPSLKLEPKLQIDDKTRLDATKTFVSKDEATVTLVEIEPEGSAGYIDVTGSSSSDWYLDWSYSGASRTVTVSVRVTTDGSPTTSTADIEIVTASDDKLFSDDQDLLALESDILDFIRPGRNSFLDFHRKSQYLIIDQLNDEGTRDTDYERLTAAAFVDVDEVKKWSKYLTLALIFEDLSNAVDDVFQQKRQFYLSQVSSARDKSVLRLDLDGDGTVADGEGIQVKSRGLVRL